MAHTIICLTHDNTTNQRGRRGKDLLRVGINKALGCVSGVERGKDRILVGPDAVAMVTLSRIVPNRYFDVIRKLMPLVRK